MTSGCHKRPIATRSAGSNVRFICVFCFFFKLLTQIFWHIPVYVMQGVNSPTVSITDKQKV